MRRLAHHVFMLCAILSLVIVVALQGCGGITEPSASPLVIPESQQERERLLVEAAFQGDQRMVTSLLQAGVDVNAKYGADPRAFTLPHGGWPMNGAGWTALHAAAAKPNPRIVEMLLQKAAGPDADDGGGFTPLLLAIDADGPDSEAAAILLIEAGADVNVTTKRVIDGPVRETPLHRAALGGQMQTVVALIEAGANVNAENSYGKTPLDHAILAKQIETARILTARGGKAGSGRGKPPSHIRRLGPTSAPAPSGA